VDFAGYAAASGHGTSPGLQMQSWASDEPGTGAQTVPSEQAPCDGGDAGPQISTASPQPASGKLTDGTGVQGPPVPGCASATIEPVGLQSVGNKLVHEDWSLTVAHLIVHLRSS
jgi:hypothetical protein